MTKSSPELINIPDIEGSNKKANVFRIGQKDRRPKSYISRYGARSKSTFADTTLRDPYDSSMKDRFEDTYRSDGQVKRAIDKRVEIITGKHGKTVIDTTQEWPSFEERSAEVQRLSADSAYTEAKKQIDLMQRLPAIRFHQKIISACKQCFVYGRAAIEVVKGPDDWPVALHVLNSKRLGRVEVDPDTWQFLGVHYQDLPSHDDLLTAEDILYFTINDDHISPRTLHYGLSMLEPVVDASETKRIIKQEDLKEAAKALYAGVAFIRFLNEAVTPAEMQNFANQITPGGWTSHKYDIEVQVEAIASNLEQLINICDFINREELRDIGVPSFLGGYEQIANYANSQQVLLAFKECEVEMTRTWLSDIIESQWLNPLFYKLTRKEIEQELTEGEPPEAKLNYEFEDVTFETILDKVNGIMPLFDRHLVSGEKVLKFVDMEDVVEEYKNLELQRQTEQERQFQLKLEAMKMSNEKATNFGQQAPPFAERAKEQASSSIPRQALLYEKLLAKLDKL